MDVGNLWLIHMDWVPGCAILHNIKQTNHNKSLTNQDLQGSQIQKTSSPFWPSNDSTKKTRVIILPTQTKYTFFSGKSLKSNHTFASSLIPAKKGVPFNDPKSSLQKISNQMDQESKLSSTCDTSQLLMIFSSISTLVKVPSFHSSPKKRMDFLVVLKRDKKNGSIYKIEIYGCFLKWSYPQIIHFYGDFHHKPSMLGYPYFWKHPYKKWSERIGPQ